MDHESGIGTHAVAKDGATFATTTWKSVLPALRWTRQRMGIHSCSGKPSQYLLCCKETPVARSLFVSRCEAYQLSIAEPDPGNEPLPMIDKLPQCLSHAKDILAKTHLSETFHILATEASRPNICFTHSRRPARRTATDTLLGAYIT